MKRDLKMSLFAQFFFLHVRDLTITIINPSIKTYVPNVLLTLLYCVNAYTVSNKIISLMINKLPSTINISVNTHTTFSFGSSQEG